MNVPTIHAIPMHLALTHPAVSSAHVMQVTLEMDLFAQVRKSGHSLLMNENE